MNKQMLRNGHSKMIPVSIPYCQQVIFSALHIQELLNNHVFSVALVAEAPMDQLLHYLDFQAAQHAFQIRKVMILLLR